MVVASLVGLVAILSLTLVLGGFLGGSIVARERKKTTAEKEKATELAAELQKAHKKALADAARIEGATAKMSELARDNAGFGEANRKLAAELADERTLVGHLDETNRALKDGLDQRDKDLAELAEHAGHFATLADGFRRKYGSKRTTE